MLNVFSIIKQNILGHLHFYIKKEKEVVLSALKKFNVKWFNIMKHDVLMEKEEKSWRKKNQEERVDLIYGQVSYQIPLVPWYLY